MQNINRLITRSAIFTALAAIFYIFFSFPFPFLPLFLKINFSDVVALLGTYAFGPLVGTIIQGGKIIIKILFEQSNTGYIGELSDLILGIVLVLPAGITYKKLHNFKGALIGMGVSMVIHVTCAMLLNHFLLIPFYVNLYGEEMVMGLCKMIPQIKNPGWSLILYGVLPFNILRNLIIFTITILLYKRLHNIIKIIEKKVSKEKEITLEE